jgi:hypothetical protein
MNGGRDDAILNDVYLLALQGMSTDEIAERLHLPPEAVADICTGDLTQPIELSAPSEAQDELENRMSVARIALVTNDFLTIAAGEDLLGDADAGIGIWDVVAHALSDLVDASVEVASSVTGVRQAVREDREFIGVYGKNVDLAELERTMRAWWTAILERVAAGESLG